jgi:hypothetical protein
MNEKYGDSSAKTATAEVEGEAAHPADAPSRSTTAGLGMFERVNSLVGTNAIGVSSGVGGSLEAPTIHDDIFPTTSVEGSTRFTDDDDRHWREVHGSRPYANPASNYEEYRPAYQYGTEAAHRFKGTDWSGVEGHLERGWDQAKGSSNLSWQHVKAAVRDAWHRVERSLSGDDRADLDR